MILNISKIFDNKSDLYPVSNDVDEYIEGNNEDEYLIFASTGNNKKTLENYTELWDEVQDQIELISGNKPIEYFMKIKFEPDDEINILVFLRSTFQESNTYYPQVFYMSVFMSMNINWKMPLMLLYE